MRAVPDHDQEATSRDPEADTRPEVGPFEIRRRWSIYAILSGCCLALAAGFGYAAWLRDDIVLWVVAAGFGLLCLLVAQGVRDARTPLFVADEHGVRMRDGDGWIGLLWSEMADIRVERREGRHDARVKVVSPDGERIHTAPVGFSTTASPGEAEVQLARRRGPTAY